MDNVSIKCVTTDWSDNNYSNVVIGYYSNIDGYNNVIMGPYNFAHGNNNLIFGNSNIVNGSNNVIFGNKLNIVGDNHYIVLSTDVNKLTDLMLDKELVYKLLLFKHATQLVLPNDILRYIVNILYNIRLTKNEAMSYVTHVMMNALRQTNL